MNMTFREGELTSSSEVQKTEESFISDTTTHSAIYRKWDDGLDRFKYKTPVKAKSRAILTKNKIKMDILVT